MPLIEGSDGDVEMLILLFGIRDKRGGGGAVLVMILFPGGKGK